MTEPRAETTRTARLLLIEDDDRIARLIARTLSDEGYHLDRAATGPSGLDAALAGGFDLVILDLMLPGMDGTVVLQRLLEQRPEQRVLVLSAVPEIATRVACLEAGAADFLGKPFAIAELIARVRSRIRVRAPGPANDVLIVGPVRLDLRLHRAEVGGRLVNLSYREFMLLCHLMQRAGRPCSRAELLEDVWEMSFDPGSNVVDVSVRRLRAKLDHPDRIETVRNVGYRFNVD
ncbi:DNA-binding response OmpR family regulator [Allocatelliglobosispora scoriae]|uniref:DNA-binding response OmpR family regulator n=1 Tax=Allocatelliglobosispora scoriae TaxID=643052 RepID=A0A841BRL5_9ACTN|nr:response regulator transcription factor [Allocatelliglobosispora scoriae]MBB5869839.1 DNA-binding response OmpR family regulator [Allocatelliglobosispora scoriae]